MDSMNDAEFFNQIVLPTVEDFSNKPGNLRLGILACLVLQAMNEHWFRHHKSDLGKLHNCTKIEDFKTTLRANDKAFGQIMDIANGTKHADKRFDDLHYEVPAAVGILRAGFPLSSENYVFMDDDNTWPLCQLTEYVAGVWKTKLGII